MKKALLSIVLLCSIVVMLIVSCTKSYNKGTPTQSLNQLFSGLRPTPQSLSVTAGRDTVIFGADSTMLHFYTNSFLDANNNIITSGTINLQLVEMYKPGDYIANRTSTISNNTILTSGGEINITATMNGQTITANRYGVGFKQPGSSSDTMALFYGTSNTPDSVVTWNIGNINLVGGGITYGTINDTGITTYNYIFDSCTGFNTVNCDYFGKFATLGSQWTDASVIVPNANFNGSNTEIFLMFPSYKVSVPIGLYNSATNSFSINYHGMQVPVGLSYELVVITNNNGNYYYYETSGTTTSGMSVTVAPAPDSEGDIIARLAGL